MVELASSATHQGLIVRGLVQGVGFRPWVWRLAHELQLTGWVLNTGAGVEIQAWGNAQQLAQLRQALWQAPFPAQVRSVDLMSHTAHMATPDVPAAPDTPDTQDAAHTPNSPPITPPTSFEIRESRSAPLQTWMGADLAVCPTCLAELFTPGNRRWLHPFIHCTQCGPRLTVIRQLPFDREHTSLAGFPLCAACAQEVANPADRRFHDQTNACLQCGPRLSLIRQGLAVAGDPLAQTWQLIRDGGIVAIKGVGGFHLCCDARQADAVARLRQLKRRPAKPLALMAANTASLHPWVKVQPHEGTWLESPQRPIVLLEQTPQANQHMPGIAPGLAWLGAMLPYTPVHYLLFHEAAGRPDGHAWLNEPQDLILVMTSGNPPGEPLVIDNEAALATLAPWVDGVLLHDRDIVTRNDDSVLRVRPDGSACWLRRGRGYAPLPIMIEATLHTDALEGAPVQTTHPAILAMGGDLKNTVCQVAPHDTAMALSMSPHVGDLSSPATRHAAWDTAERMVQSLACGRHTIGAVACDGHPDYASSQLAAKMVSKLAGKLAPVCGPTHGLALIPVQHHHAHVAAVMAEHQAAGARPQPVIGLALDGLGWGTDGQAWGGELLWVDRHQFQRLGRLAPLPLPGGDRAAREPWRMGAALLHTLGRGDQIPRWFELQSQAPALAQWLATSNVPQTSSLGRLFDATAGLLHVLATATHEADAAMRLESLAFAHVSLHGLPPPMEGGCLITHANELNWHPLMQWLCDQMQAHPMQAMPPQPSPSSGHTVQHVPPTSQHPRAYLAARFHATLAHALAQWAAQAAQRAQTNVVVLSGGCMANRLLDDALTHHLSSQGLQVWQAREYPCGDGGLSLGQAWVAYHQQQATKVP